MARSSESPNGGNHDATLHGYRDAGRRKVRCSYAKHRHSPGTAECKQAAGTTGGKCVFNQSAHGRAAVMCSGEGSVMKKLLAIVVASLAFVLGQPLVVQHWSEAAAQIPLPSGQFSASAQGSFGICISNAGTPESCSTSGAIVLALTGLANGSFTFDSAGNGCGMTSEVDSFPLAPIYLGPPPFPGYPPVSCALRLSSPCRNEGHRL